MDMDRGAALSAAAVDTVFQGGLSSAGGLECRAGSPAAGGTIRFVLLGASWTARAEEPEPRRPRRQRQG